MKQTLTILGLFLTAPWLAAQGLDVDAMPARGILRIGTGKLRHGDRIMCLAYSPDGNVLAAGGGNDPLRLWNPKTGNLTQIINEPWVHAMAYSPSGKTLAFGGYQRHIRLWNFELGRENGRLDGHKTAVKSIALSPDGSQVASGSQDGGLIFWNLATQRILIELKPHADEVTAVAFSPVDSNVLASASYDGYILIWTGIVNNPSKKIAAGCGVLALAFSPDGGTLYSAGDDSLIRRWDVATGKQTGVFKGHQGTVVSVVAIGDSLISGSLDRTIRIWDAKTTVERKSLPRGLGDCDALAVTSKGDFVATAGSNNAIRIFATDTGNEVVHAPGASKGGLVGLALSADQQRIASITSDGQTIVWNAPTGKLIKQWDIKQSGEFAFALAPDGKTIATAANEVTLWNADNGTEVARFGARANDPVMALAYSPDSKSLALALRSGLIEVWDARGKAQISKFQYQGPLHAIAWSPDGKRLAAAGGPKVVLWQPPSDTIVQSFAVKAGPPTPFPTVRTLAFGPDGRTLAAGGWDAIIRIYNLNAKDPGETREQRRCEGHLSAIFSLSFSPDGRSLVSGSFDRTVRLWEAFSGKQIAQFKGHIGEVHGVAFLKDGRSFFSAGTDSNVFAWDVPGLTGNGKLPPLTLGPNELNNAWQLLASEETPKAHDMMWRCIASAKQAVPFLTKDLYYLEPELVKKWFRDLNSAHFPTRTAAMEALEKKGRWMEGRYDAALVNPPSLEYERRIQMLKEKLNASNSVSLVQERLRVRRIMLMCEQSGTADAIDALQKLAEKGPEEELREEAKASLARLKK